MAPDLNSLPASRPSRRSSLGHDVGSLSKSHAASVYRTSPHISPDYDIRDQDAGRRRLSGGLGGVIDRGRRMSLGQLHQELENEQEAQVNRLLRLIRLQQDQLTALVTEQQDSAVDDAQSNAAPSSASSAGGVNTAMRAPSISHGPTLTTSRSSSHRSVQQSDSQNALPTSSTSNENTGLAAFRDECAFYQTETQTLTRENQMLKQRIQELERQLSGATS